MKVYFSNNCIVFVEGYDVKWTEGYNGYYNGIDLYEENALTNLRHYFELISKSGELQSFWEIYCPNEGDLDDDFRMELEQAVIVYMD